MANPSTLYRFHIELADVDRGVYDNLDFRIAMHPSESLPYLVTRVLAFILNQANGIAFSPGGLSNPDEPCIHIKDPGGAVQLWIEVGNPSTRKLHRAAKSAKSVRVYTYRDPEILAQEIQADQVYGSDRIELFYFAPKFLNQVATYLGRDNNWNVMLSDEVLTVTCGELFESCEVKKHAGKPMK